MIKYILNPQTIDALGWTLLHSLWQGAVFALLLVLILIALRSYSAKSRYFVSVGLLCAFFLTLTGTFYLQWQDANGALVSATELLNEQEAHDVFLSNDGIRDAQVLAAEEINAMPYSNETLRSEDGNWLVAFRDYYNQHLPLLVTVWFLGVLFLQLRFLGQLAYVQRLKHYGAQLFPSTWNDKIEELEGKLRIQKKVRYLTSIRVESPMVIGWLKPVILIPQQLFSSLSETEIYAVLAHELAHIRREDFIVNLMQTFLCNVFFFHPGVWWMSNRIDDEREHCCDDLAVAATGPATTYAKTLINVSELQLKMHTSPQLAMALAGKKEDSGFSGRIRRLFTTSNGKGSFREGFATALILVSALFLGVAATGSTAQTLDQNELIDEQAEVIGADEKVDNVPVPETKNTIVTSPISPPPPPPPPPLGGSDGHPASNIVEEVDAENAPTVAEVGIKKSDDTRIDALVMACAEGDYEFVKTLVKSGIDIEGVNTNGVTPLMMATSNNELQIVEYLLRQGADVNQNSNNWTALIEAADEGSIESMKLLLKAGADINYYKNPGSPTAITMAASEGHIDCLKLLIESGADINGVGKSMPPLHLAAGENKKKIVDYLIAQKVDLDKKDVFGRTALMYAASEGKRSVVIRLVEAGADVSIVDSSGDKAEHYAKYEQEYIIQDYLNRQDDDNSDVGDRQDDSIYDIKDDWDREERSGIHYATWKGHIEKVKRLVKKGVDVNSKDEVGRTPLHIAAAQGYDLDVRVLLLGLGADINVQDKEGRTPLMYAAANGLEDVVALLVSLRADVNIRDVDGMSAYEWAQSGDNTDLVNFLGLITQDESQFERDFINGNRSTEKNENLSIAQDDEDFEYSHRTDRNVNTTIHKDIHTEVNDDNYNLEKKTPTLLEAIRNRNQQACALLLSKGESANSVNDCGITALMIAVSNNQYDIAAMLIANGADVNMTASSGVTALHYAALENHAELATLLLDNNAIVDPTMRYSSTDGNRGDEILVREYIGATPLLIAAESGNIDVLSVLVEADAKTGHTLIRNEYRLTNNRKSYLSGGEVMGVDEDFLKNAELINSNDKWTPYKQVLLLEQARIILPKE